MFGEQFYNCKNEVALSLLMIVIEWILTSRPRCEIDGYAFEVVKHTPVMHDDTQHYRVLLNI